MSFFRPTKFAHIVYRTRRFDAMLQWYETVFGARVQFENPSLAFLTYDDEHHRFAFANMSVIQPDGDGNERRGMIGVDHVAYTYESVTALVETYARLKDAAILPYWCVHHGITASMYFADPDGNQMEFQVDSLASSDEASDYMRTQWTTNLIGVEFDPEDWLTRLHSGTPESELLVRTVHEPESPIRGQIEVLLAEHPSTVQDNNNQYPER